MRTIMNANSQTTDSVQPDSSAEEDQIATQQVTVAGHDLTIFAESQPMISALVADIRSAQTRVWIESYIVVDDDSGRAVAAAMVERAQAGIDVRLMYDDVGCTATPSKFFSDLAAAGVQVHAYHTFWEALKYGSAVLQIFNRRNHRKLAVIDDRTAFFGGMNILDQRDANVEGASDLPASAGWHDVHIRLVGPQQQELVESFERSWRRAHHEKVRRRSRAYRQALLPTDEEFIRFFDSGPGLKYSRAARLFLKLIRGAKKQVLLSMAYFIPTGPILRALVRARKHAIRIEVIIPAKSDVKLVQWATQYLYAKCLRHGMRVYEREKRMLHSKVMVVDDDLSVVGSCNLDPRSLEINLELVAVIRSTVFATAMIEICEHERSHSSLVTRETLVRQNWWQRLRNRLAYALRWWL
jgi:cardiolipin synthase